MSITRAFQADLAPAAKLVLLAMTHTAKREADRLLCETPPSRIADMAGIDSKQLQAALCTLVFKELIADTGRRVGKGGTLHVFELLLPEGA